MGLVDDPREWQGPRDGFQGRGPRQFLGWGPTTMGLVGTCPMPPMEAHWALLGCRFIENRALAPNAAPHLPLNGEKLGLALTRPSPRHIAELQQPLVQKRPVLLHSELHLE